MSFAVVPIKHLSRSKTRLASRLERDALEQLCLAMLRDILAALQKTPSLDRVVVVTPDPSVAEASEAAGAIALLREDPGLNESIDAAIHEAGTPGESVLVVLGDVAGALPEEVERLFETVAEADTHPVVALAPSRDGGTAALLRAPCDAIASCFGPDSAARHREAACERGVTLREIALPSLDIDLDHPEDIDDFLARPGGGEETRRTLANLGWTRPPENHT
ncbi:MAG: 2-phospho-L-lactate guanylyltransferase [Myxococcota bacterium]|jgi:2-phospho-L-lactate guanylyltransferase|nr:2-phospho-L-lactate guanylyltransferase [Myxococcota bacterium]